MIWLSIIQNEGLLVLAETLVIIIGSMLLGILLAWFFWGKLKDDKIELQAIVDEEKRRQEDLRDQISQLLHEREQLQNELGDVRTKLETQSKLIFDQNNRLFNADRESNQHREIVDGLQGTIDSYQHRLRMI